MSEYTVRRSALACSAFAAILSVPSVASANEGGLLGTASVLVDVGLFVVILACLLSVFKLHASIRGGKLALGWRWFIMGFGLLGAAQILFVIGETDLLLIPSFWVGVMRVVALILFLVGATRMRKLLT